MSKQQTVKVWVVTYVDDEYADELGSKVFYTEAEARAFYDGWTEPSSEWAEPHRFANYEAFDIDTSRQ